MVKIPYIEYDTDDMILRDFLALHRSQLANERTFLAYARTALALSGGGITLAKLFEDRIVQVIGWILIPIGFLVVLTGIYRYLSVRQHFNDLDNNRDPVNFQYDEEKESEYQEFKE